MEARHTHRHSSGILADHATQTVANSAAFPAPHLEPGMHLLASAADPDPS